MRKKKKISKILKDAIFDNEELLKKMVQDEIELIYLDYKSKIRSLIKDIQKEINES